MIALVKSESGPGHVGLKDVPRPSPSPGQVMIRIEVAGVCGSDLHILRHDIRLNLQPPVVMGHEFCGVVEGAGDGVTGFEPGDRVTSETTVRSCGSCRHCRSGSYNLCVGKELIGYVHDGCFAPYCVVPASMVHRLPAGLSFGEGALCEPLACCVHAALEQTGVSSGDTVVIAGAGAIGLLCAQVASAVGAKALLCGLDTDAERLSVAESLGVAGTIDVTGEDPVERVRSATDGEGADVFLECSGAAAAASTGLTLVRRGGRFCQVGLFGRAIEIDFEQIAYKELTVTGSVGSRRSSWLTALDMLETGKVKLKPLAGDPLPLTAWEEAFRMFEAKEGIKVLLRPE